MASQFKTFTAGSVLTASEVNAYLMKQAVIVCDSTADYPASPVEGMTVYDKGADSLKVYTTATTCFRAPWNMAHGVVPATAGGTSGYGFARLVSSPQTGITSATDITNATVTFTAVANRLYRVMASGSLTGSTSGYGQLQVLLDGNAIASGVVEIQTAGAGRDRFAIIDTVFTTTSGSKVVKVQGSSDVTMTVNHATATPTNFAVMDVGPASAPA